MSGSSQHGEAMRNKVNLKMLLELQPSPPTPPSGSFKAAGEVSEPLPGAAEAPERDGRQEQLAVSVNFFFFFPVWF